jgi:hypothetical protein
MVYLAAYSVTLALTGVLLMVPPLVGYAVRQRALRRAGWLR